MPSTVSQRRFPPSWIVEENDSGPEEVPWSNRGNFVSGIHQFLMFGWIFATHGDCSAFPIEITVIPHRFTAVDTAIVLLPLRDMGRKTGKMLP